MLVLSRKKGQELRIGNATLKVIDIRGGVIRLGIEAPRDVAVVRTELELRAKSEQPELAGVTE